MIEIKPLTFIYEKHNALSLGACQEMIDIFEAHPEDQYEGAFSDGKIDPKIKVSTDVMIRDQPHWKAVDDMLFRSLHDALKDLEKIFPPFFKQHNLNDKGYQMQRTGMGGHYDWHYDGGGSANNRVWVAIWYLTGVAPDQGGRTQFEYQEVDITPEAGKLVMFPPYHTHRHRGERLNYGLKYLATTWVVEV